MIRDPAPATASQGVPPIYRQLMAVCLLGTTRGLLADAEVAAAAVRLTVDDPRPFEVCRAIAGGMAGDPAGARQLLAQDDSDDDAFRVAVATALLMAGDSTWRSVIDGVLARCADPPVRQAANDVIAFAATLH